MCRRVTSTAKTAAAEAAKSQARQQVSAAITQVLPDEVNRVPVVHRWRYRMDETGTSEKPKISLAYERTLHRWGAPESTGRCTRPPERLGSAPAS